MRKPIRTLMATTCLTALLASPLALAQNRDVDPIFQVTGNSQSAANCVDSAGDDRNILVRGATSTAGQTIIGGLLGAAAGNQIGGGSGKDIATGVGAAAGASAGAYNAQRQREARIRNCQQSRNYTSNQTQTRSYEASANAPTSNSGPYRSNYNSNSNSSSGNNYDTSAAAGFTPNR